MKGSNKHIRKFIDIVDRYLEVAFVYHERLASINSDVANGRLKRVVDDLEKIVPVENCKPIEIVIDGQGQNIAPDSVLIELTSIYQKIIVSRLKNGGYGAFEPRNSSAFIQLMEKDPKDYLGKFGSTSFAWDVLNETASLCFLPKLTQLEQRDLLCMHSLELRQHLSKVLTQELINDPDSVIALQGEFRIGKLQNINTMEDLVGLIISQPVYWNNDFRKLAKQVKSFFNESAKQLYLEIKLEDIEKAIIPYMDVDMGFSKETNAKKVVEVCQKMVIYGLCISYLAWMSACDIKKDEIDVELLARHILFTTRTLLDEKCWLTCRYVSDLAYKYRILINKANNKSNTFDKTYMLFANRVFAQKMSKDIPSKQIKDEVNAWDVSSAHSRYKFLKYVLLGDYKAAKSEGEKLINLDSNNQINITYNELMSWPILEDFRLSDEGKQLIDLSKQIEST